MSGSVSTSTSTCDICYDDLPASACYTCDATAGCITCCSTCFITWGKPLCMKCNKFIFRGQLVKWLTYRVYLKHISPYWEDIHVKHEKTLLPVVQRYLDWCDYIVYKKRFARWGTQMVARGFVAKPELEDLDLDTFSSDELAQDMANTPFYTCTKPTCNGLVIYSKCGGCGSSYCSKCREIMTGAEHQCNPAILKSVNELKESSKPCPACRTSITKDGGCNDMRCSNCGAHFSWSSGKIMQTNTNPLRDDEVFGKTALAPEVVGLDTGVAKDMEYILCHRDASAIVKYAKEFYNSEKLIRKFNSETLKLRVKVIKGAIDEKKWGAQLVQLVDSCDSGKLIGDILIHHASNLKNPDSTDSWENKVKKAVMQLDEVAASYQCKVPSLKQVRTKDPPVI